MRRKFAMGTLGFMVLMAAAVVSWAQDGPPNGPGPGPGQHLSGDGGHHEWGDGPRHFEQDGPGRFGGPEGRMHGGWEHGGMHEFGGGEHLLRMAENPRVRMVLGLTDEQVGRLHTIGVDAEKSSIQSRADLELRHIELRELLRAENPDHDAIMQKLDELNAARGKMEKRHVETLLSARAVLTPEQAKKVRAFMEGGGFHGGPEERGHMMEHHGGMGHGEHGPGPGGPATPPPAPPAQ
jgi:Spy/CpxP family protein refolding chaperone